MSRSLFDRRMTAYSISVPILFFWWIFLAPLSAHAATPPVGAALCAVESGTCKLAPGTAATVYYGALNSYYSKANVVGSVGCGTTFFGGDPQVYVLKGCYAVVTSTGGSVYAPSLPVTAQACATEGGTCVLAPGTTATVYYGTSGTFVFKTGVSGSISCGIAAFGTDPVPNVVKGCYATGLPTNAALCATEGGTCNLLAGTTATVFYGAGIGYLPVAGVTGSINCGVKAFGGDPAVYVVKSCYAVATNPGGGLVASGLPPLVSPCAPDGGTCSTIGGSTATVYYGAGTQYYAVQGVVGSVGCNTTTFGGDPAPKVLKSCFMTATNPGGVTLTGSVPVGVGQCATGETGTCVLTPGTTATIYYGTGNSYAAKTGVVGSLACNQASFGVDPDPWIVKGCYAAMVSPTGSIGTNALPSGSVKCADAESGMCTAASGTTATIYYGAGGSYLFRTGLSGTVSCSVPTFGGDPTPGVYKACYSPDPTQGFLPVNLSSYFNVPAIASDPATSSATMFNQSGIPYSYSQTMLGSPVVWNGSAFTFGAADAANAVSNVTVPLPKGSYGRLDVLASRVSGGKANETFTVTYTDGSTSVFSQGMSDWWNNATGSANYPNEATVAYMTTLHSNAAGTAYGQASSLYGYTFALNAAKTLLSVTLPADSSVGVLAMTLGAANVAPALPSAGPAVAVVTHHNDAWRTGSNSNEYQLTPATVGNVTGSNLFGRLGTITLDEAVDAQPLVVPNITVTGDPNPGSHDVVYVATRNNTIYAIDPTHLTVLLQRNFGSPVANPLGGFNQGQSGLRATPVIDLGKGAMYAMTYVQTANNGPQYILHMLSLTTLNDMVTPVTVAASASTSSGSIPFNATYEMQRPALLETNGQIVVAFGSWGDLSPDQSRGWVLSFDATTLQLNTAGADLLNKLPSSATNNYFLSSVWMSGGGPAADEAGNIYFSTGNSSAGSYDGVNNIQESVVKTNPSNGRVLSLYTPSNVNDLDAEDNDLGSGSVVLLPDPTKRVGAILGKDGFLRVFNRDNLGGNSDSNLVSMTQSDRCSCGVSYFSDGLDHIVTSGGTHLRIYSWQTGQNPGLTLQATAQIPSSRSGGAFTSISSGGTANGIIWVVPGPNIFGATGMNLMAYQATPVNGVLPLLYMAPAGGWLFGYGGGYHIPPTVVNGKVYVASQKQLAIFGFGGTR